MTHELALAALTVLDAGPLGQVAAAEAAGFDSVGLRLKPLLADDAVTIGDAAAERALKARLAASGLGVLEVGVVAIEPDLKVDELQPLLAFSAGIGARLLVCPVGDDDRSRRRDTLAGLAAAAAPFGLTPLIEFNPYSACPNLDAAVALLGEVGEDNLGLCIDAFHLSRSGGDPADLAAVEPDRLRLLHLCDAAPLPAERPDVDAIRAESRGGRLLPGEGVLWLPRLLAALPPAIPVSVEAPSRSFAELPAAERARRALAATRRLLAEPFQ